jgi:type IV pilus assembly protein PilA
VSTDRRRPSRGFTLLELMTVLAIIGILAMLAIPNFVRFQARSKQAEPKLNLKGLYTAERAYESEHGTYTTCLRKVGFSPERANRFQYVINTTDRVDDPCPQTETRNTGPGTTHVDDGRVLADEWRYGADAVATDATVPLVGYTAVPPAGSTVIVQNDLVGVTPNTASPSGSFGAAAQGNIDWDGQLDLWYISSVPTLAVGICPVLAGGDQNTSNGEPRNVYNDVNCP